MLLLYNIDVSIITSHPLLTMVPDMLFINITNTEWSHLEKIYIVRNQLSPISNLK
jgi:hypothetical protein